MFRARARTTNPAEAYLLSRYSLRVGKAFRISGFKVEMTDLGKTAKGINA